MPSPRIALPNPSEQSISAGLLSPWQPPRIPPHARRNSVATARSVSTRDRIIRNAEKTGRQVIAILKAMTFLQKLAAVIFVLVGAVVGILLLVYHERIFDWLGPKAENWKDTRGGWIVLWLLLITTAFPPMVGYSTLAMVAGFIYGVGEGWLIVATATVAGSTVAFMTSRTLLRDYVQRLVAHDKRFAALSLTIKHDGVKLLCLIRLCPLPYSISNGALSTIPSIHPLMYAVATAAATPKLFVHAFIGSRIFLLSKTKEKMSPGATAVNYISIFAGSILGTAVGYYIYRKTMARARELEAEEAKNTRDSARRPGHPPAEFADDPEAQIGTEYSARDDDVMDYFDESPMERSQYHDQITDDEDVFRHGDGNQDEEEFIGLKDQRK